MLRPEGSVRVASQRVSFARCAAVRDRKASSTLTNLKIPEKTSIACLLLESPLSSKKQIYEGQLLGVFVFCFLSKTTIPKRKVYCL
jgi:hypothetical protein